MRQRKVKNEEEKVLSFAEYLVVEPETNKGQWGRLFNNNNKIHIEIGCGKGQFIATLAEKNPGTNFVAIEPIGSVLLRALEKARAKELKNIVILWKYGDDIEEFFEKDEIDKIYLNFSDPWPKDRHAKRRLTHKNFLKKYKKILKPGGIIEFKTDNRGLFDFALEEFEANGFNLSDITYDLHNTQIDSVPTEYEEKFSSLGYTINYCQAKLGVKKDG